MKKSFKSLIVLFVVFVLFSVVMFVIPSSLNAVFWTGYISTVLAIIIFIVCWIRFNNNSQQLKSKFFKLPIILIASYCVIIEMIISLVLKFANMIPTWIAVICCGIVIAVELIGTISGEFTSNYIQSVDEKVLKKTRYIDELLLEVESISQKQKDSKIKELLKELSIKIQYSDPMSDESLSGLEAEISDSISALGNGDISEEAVSSIINQLEIRNKRCKMMK